MVFRKRLRSLHVLIRAKLVQLKSRPVNKGISPNGLDHHGLHPVREEDIIALKTEDIAVFVPKIEHQRTHLTWRRVVFGTLLFLYDLGVGTLKLSIKVLRRVIG